MLASNDYILKSSRQLKLEGIDKDYEKNLAISKNVSKILDKLLKGYDKRIRPNYAGKLVKIEFLRMEFN